MSTVITPGFVYAAVRWVQATSTIQVDVRPRRGSRPHCSCCGKAAPGYDLLPTRRFEFIPIRGYALMRVCSCACCGSRLNAPSTLPGELAMLLARLLNACHHFPGFVYAAVRLNEATSTIEVDVRPRRGSKAHCSCCGKSAPGYDLLPTRRFVFIPICGYAVT